MKIPLSVYPTDDGLIIYRNNTVEKVSFPFKPYVLAQKDKFSNIQGSEEIWTKVPEDIEKTYIRLEYNNPKATKDFSLKNRHLSNFCLDNNYIEQVYITQPDFFFKYPHEKSLIVMFYDIETMTTGNGLFPKPASSAILCIGYSIWEYKNDGTKQKIHHEICKGFNVETLNDKLVIDSFLDKVQKWDPNIMSGFNNDIFDDPFLIERGKINRCDLTKLCKGGREPSINNNIIRFPGRIRFDIYNSNSGVSKDQTLFGIKSKGLKDIARWYKVPRTIFENNQWIEKPLEDIEIKEHIENTLKLFKENPELLYNYLDDDIYRTEGTGNIYLRNCITLAEMNGTTLDNTANMYSSFIPKLLLARNMYKRKLINTETNFSRYNLQTGTIAKLSNKLKYQGAISELYQSGYQSSIYKEDFSSQYPSCIQTFNLGPDTTKLISVEEYTGKYECRAEGIYNWYRIPTSFDDEKYKYDLIVRIRNDKEGFLKQEINRLKKERLTIKNEIKSISNSDKKGSLTSQQIALKIILNSIYGLLGEKTTVYGDTIIATIIPSLCRWCSLKLIQKNKDSIVEVDTDGLILNKNINIDEENIWIEKEIINKFHIKENFLKLEKEGTGNRAYFYKAKNYIIEKNPGDYEIHGSSLKGSKHCKVVDKAIKLGIDYIFNNKSIDEVIYEAYDLSRTTVDDYIERVKLTKDKIEYDDIYNFRLFLAQQVEDNTGEVLTKDAQINYVVAKNQLSNPDYKKYYRDKKYYTYSALVSNVSDLNISYYDELIDKALAKFGIDKLKYQTMDLFGQIFEKKPLGKGIELATIYEGEL